MRTLFLFNAVKLLTLAKTLLNLCNMGFTKILEERR